MKIKHQFIYSLIISGLFFSNSAFAGAPLGGNPNYEIRIYCEYRDNQQNKNITFKLLDGNKNTVKVNAVFIRHMNNVRYTVGQPRFDELINECKKKINDQAGTKGEFLGLKGTNAGNYEALTLFYPVKLPNQE